MKTDDRIVAQVTNRIKAKRNLLRKLRKAREEIQAEIDDLWYRDTVEDLAKEFGIGKSTISRIAKGIV